MGQKTWYWAAEGGEDTPYATCGCSEIHTGGRKSSQELKAENMNLFSYQSTHRNHLCFLKELSALPKRKQTEFHLLLHFAEGRRDKWLEDR